VNIMTDYKSKTDEQILEELKAKFDDTQVKSRKGPYNKATKSYQYFKYIPVSYIWERLDKALGANWNLEVVDVSSTSFRKRAKGHKDPNGNYVPGPMEDVPGVFATVRLTVTFPSGAVSFRDGVGGASTGDGMDVGDAQKIALSNALKKAASMFGVGAYLGTEGLESQDDTSTWGSSNSSGWGGNNNNTNQNNTQNWGNPTPAAAPASAPAQNQPIATATVPWNTGGNN
jgi:hypothetical protein